jgi:hypothetical protein
MHLKNALPTQNVKEPKNYALKERNDTRNENKTAYLEFLILEWSENKLSCKSKKINII